MKKLTLIILVAFIPILTIAQKRSKKDKANNTTSLASYEFMVITGYQLMAPVPEGMSDELAGPNGAEIQAKLNVSSYMESRIIVSFDLSGVTAKDEEDLSSRQYKSMSEAVNSAAVNGWDFVSANVISENKLKIHYYYMRRNK
jgi:hypothetical protein